MTRFSLTYGFDLAIASFNFVMKNKRLLVYMLVASLTAAGLAFFFFKNQDIIDQTPEGFLIRSILFEALAAFFTVPLIYSVIALVRNKKPAFYTFNTLARHLGAIVGYILLLVFSKLIIWASLVSVVNNNFFIIIVPDIVLFFVSLLYYFVLVAAVVENVDFSTALKKSFVAVKHTLYSILAGSLWCYVLMVALFILFLPLLWIILVILFLPLGVFFPVFLFLPQRIYYLFSFPLLVGNIGLLLHLLMNALWHTLYATVYIAFQTLLYLKYKDAVSDSRSNDAPVEPEL